MQHLPCLACLNYPNTVRPKVEKLPTSLRTDKWEDDCKVRWKSWRRIPLIWKLCGYMVEERARAKNHENVLAAWWRFKYCPIGAYNRNTIQIGDHLQPTQRNQRGKRQLRQSQSIALSTSVTAIPQKECKAFAKTSLEDFIKICPYISFWVMLLTNKPTNKQTLPKTWPWRR